MKKLFKLTLAVALLVSCGNTSFAQKLGVINMGELIMVMPERDSALANYQKYEKELSDVLESISVEYRKKVQDYQQTSGTLSASVKDIRLKEISDLEARFTEYQQQAGQDLNAMSEELMAPVIQKANDAVKKVAKDNKFLMVYEVNDVLYYYDEALVTNLLDMAKKELGITK